MPIWCGVAPANVIQFAAPLVTTWDGSGTRRLPESRSGGSTIVSTPEFSCKKINQTLLLKMSVFFIFIMSIGKNMTIQNQSQ
jgi:hypothetical protein